MYSYKKFISFMLFCILHILASSLKNYGPFKLSIKSLETCKGPKRKDCTEITTWVLHGGTIFYDLTAKEDVMPTKAKMTVLSNGKPLIRMQIKKPCGHFFLQPMFMSLFNATKNCVILKGRYILHLDIDEMAQKYYGGMSLYGNMTFKALFYSDNCNFSCTSVGVIMAPRNSTS